MPKQRRGSTVGTRLLCAVFLFIAIAGGCRIARAETDALHDELFALQAQIAAYRARIAESQDTVQTLRDAAARIDERQKKFALELALASLSLENSRLDIARVEQGIAEYAKKIEHERAVISQLLRNVSYAEYAILPQVLLEQGVRGRLEDVRRLEYLHNALFETTRDVRTRQKALVVQKKGLEEEYKKRALLHEISLRETSALQEEQERKAALAAHTNRRLEIFADLLKRSELKSFSLQEEFFAQEGVGKKLQLEEAFTHADSISRRLQIRPALLLALVAQESHFGESQGTGTWKDDMHPSQWAGFITIVKRLGLNPDLVPVSKKPEYGWGGALGPAQFLPSTWLGYEARVGELTGHGLPSPWNIDDAMAGAALKLVEAGAAAKTQAAERKAALIYFAGDNWDNPAFDFYADSVLELAQEIEKELRL